MSIVSSKLPSVRKKSVKYLMGIHAFIYVFYPEKVEWFVRKWIIFVYLNDHHKQKNTPSVCDSEVDESIETKYNNFNSFSEQLLTHHRNSFFKWMDQLLVYDQLPEYYYYYFFFQLHPYLKIYGAHYIENYKISIASLSENIWCTLHFFVRT